MKIGDVVVYVDQFSRHHSALVTNVWDNPAYELLGAREPGLNLVLVSDNDAETDQYGRQIKRETSVVHVKNQPASGRYWMRLTEEFSKMG